MIKYIMSFFITLGFGMNISHAALLVCRGLTPDQSTSSQSGVVVTIEVDPPAGNAVLTTFFGKSPVRYSPGALPAGSCTWFDRGMTASDPSQMIHRISAGANNFTVPRIEVVPLDNRYPVTQFNFNGSSLSSVPYLPKNMAVSSTSSTNIFNSNSYFTFDVSVSGSNLVLNSVRCSGVCR